MDETPKERSARIRRSLIHLPVALFANKNGRNSLFVRLLRSKGLLGAVALAGAAGVAVLTTSYQAKKADEAKPGEETPDFNAEDLPEEKPDPSTKSSVEQAVAKVEKSSEAAEGIPTITKEPPPQRPLEKPIEKPLQDEGWMAKIKKFFSSEDREEPKPGLSAGRVFSSKLAAKKLSEDYRSKFVFDGFSSAKSLSKFGAYTDAEANMIIRLKDNGVNTSANAGVMSKDIEERIRFYSKKHGLSEEVALKMAQMESGGNPNAISATGAIGVYQFTGRTATEMGVTDRFDPDQNIEAGVLLAKKSVKKLNESDLPVTAINIYLMHQLGVSGARELIKAAARNERIDKLSKTTRNAIKHNFGGKSIKTAKEYIQNTEEALDVRSSADRFASSRPSDTAPPVQLASSVGPATTSVAVRETPSKTQAQPVPIVIAKIDEPPESTPKDAPQGGAPFFSGSSPKPNDQVTKMPQSLARTKHGIIVATS